MAEHVAQFVFILLVPILVVAGAVVTLFAVGALFDALDHPGELNDRIATVFRAQPVSGRATGPRHYYQPYWRA